MHLLKMVLEKTWLSMHRLHNPDSKAECVGAHVPRQSVHDSWPRTWLSTEVFLLSRGRKLLLDHSYLPGEKPRNHIVGTLMWGIFMRIEGTGGGPLPTTEICNTHLNRNEGFWIVVAYLRQSVKYMTIHFINYLNYVCMFTEWFPKDEYAYAFAKRRSFAELLFEDIQEVKKSRKIYEVYLNHIYFF